MSIVYFVRVYMNHKFSWLLFLLLSFPTFIVASESSEEQLEQWVTPRPLFNQEVDWLKTTSGEWVQGDIIAMYDERLEFDSDEFDVQSIKWKDIAELHSKGLQSIRLLDGTISEGRIVYIKGEYFKLVHGDKVAYYPIEELVALASSRNNSRDYWDGELGFGADFSSGNVNQINITVNAMVQRRTSSSRFKSDYLEHFSSNTDRDDVQTTTAESRRLTSIFDWYFSQKMFFRATEFEYYSDSFQNIDHRLNYGIAIGYQFVDSKKVEFSMTFGPSYQVTYFEAVGVDEDDTETSAVAVVGSEFELEITRDIDFEADYQVRFVNERSGSRIHHLRTAFEIEIIDDLDLDLTLYVDRTETPQANSEGEIPEQDDYKFVVSLAYEF